MGNSMQTRSLYQCGYIEMHPLALEIKTNVFSLNSCEKSSDLSVISWFKKATGAGISDMSSATKIECATLSQEDICPPGKHKNRDMQLN